MTSVIQSRTRAFMLSIATATLLSPMLHADCTYELFSISSAKGTSIGDFIDQISEECSMSVIVTDTQAEAILKKSLNKTYLKNLTINEVLDLIIKENNLQYTLQNNVLKISYVTSKTYNIDYIISQRKGVGSANITLSSNTSTGSSSGGTSGSSGGSSSSQSGINITSSDEVQFWEILDKEIESILNRPEDEYTAKIPMINKNAGLITVTATSQQLKRLDNYLEELQKKMQTQVLIDVKMYSVKFSKGSTTGIDWAQLYALQNAKMGLQFISKNNVTEMTSTDGKVDITTMGQQAVNNAHAFALSSNGSINEVIKFLKTQGDVYSLSNPKILTLNNQPALITAGTELFYKTTSSSTLAGGSTGTTSQNEVISSVFSGVLLDITPEISKDGSITLRVNPSISDTVATISSDNTNRSMPPDLTRRQISSVVTVKDGSRVILGGLINTKSSTDNSKVPLFGDIPLLGGMFKSDKNGKVVEEIVIIIEPHIVKKEADKLSLTDLGYSQLETTIKEEAAKDKQ